MAGHGVRDAGPLVRVAGPLEVAEEGEEEGLCVNEQGREHGVGALENLAWRPAALELLAAVSRVQHVLWPDEETSRVWFASALGLLVS